MRALVLGPLALALLALAPGRATAGEATAAGDSAWTRGDHPRAEACYRQALAEDPQASRAAFRIGLIASWSNRLDTALVWIRRARALEPQDVDMQIAEARVLSWQDHAAAALALYDSVMARDPESREAALGRAQVLSWSGRLSEADAGYAEVLARYPDDDDATLGRAEVASWRGDRAVAALLYGEVLARRPQHAGALLGLARLHLAEGRSRQAQREVARVLAGDSTHRQARALDREIDAALRPRLTGGTAWSDDSDRNVGWTQTGSSSLWLATGLWGFVSANALEASDPVRRASRRGGEAGLRWAFGSRELTVALGATEQRPQGLDRHSSGTARATVTQQVERSATVSLDASHALLDDTALLIGRRLRIDAFGLSLDAPLGGWCRLSAGGGVARLSDGNRRSSWLASLERTLPFQVSAGVLARQLAYQRRGPGYFSPDQFTLGEARATGSWTRRSWTARLQGGLGGQQTALAATGQLEWHYEVRLGRRWSTIDQLEAYFGASNSALSSNSGAYRSRTAGLSLRIGL